MLLISIMMQISIQKLQELNDVVEDTVAYACDKEMISGELAWNAILLLATEHLREFEGF